MVLHKSHIGFAGNAAFGDHGFAAKLGQQIQRLLQRNVKCAQVAVVYAHQLRGELAAFGQLALIVQLQQHRHAQFVRGALQRFELRGFQRGGNQQYGICAPSARLINLIIVDHKIFAQHRQRHCGFNLLQIIGRTLEILLIGEHRQAGRAGALIRKCDFHRVEIGSDQAFAGAGFFHFGNHSRLRGGMFGVNRGEKIAGGRGSRSLPLDFIKRHSGFGSGHFVSFGGEDFIQNIGHGAVAGVIGKRLIIRLEQGLWKVSGRFCVGGYVAG